MEAIIYLGSLLVFSVSVWLGIGTVRMYRQARINREKIKWILAQLQRAVEQIHSEDEHVIIAGLQIMAMMEDPGMRFKAFPRLTELAENSNPQIRKYARIALKKFVESADKQFRDSVDK